MWVKSSLIEDFEATQQEWGSPKALQWCSSGFEGQQGFWVHKKNSWMKRWRPPQLLCVPFIHSTQKTMLKHLFYYLFWLSLILPFFFFKKCTNQILTASLFGVWRRPTSALMNVSIVSKWQREMINEDTKVEIWSNMIKCKKTFNVSRFDLLLREERQKVSGNIDYQYEILYENTWDAIAQSVHALPFALMARFHAISELCEGKWTMPMVILTIATRLKLIWTLNFCLNVLNIIYFIRSDFQMVELDFALFQAFCLFSWGCIRLLWGMKTNENNYDEEDFCWIMVHICSAE